MQYAFVTGGAGFLGSLLVKRLLADGWGVVSIDLEPPVVFHKDLYSKQGDIRNHDDMRPLLDRHHYDVIFHVAAILGHDRVEKKHLWSSNVDGTKVVADFARYHGVSQVVYVSTNCLWGESVGRPIREDDPPKPIDLYGKSKWEAEKIMKELGTETNVVSVRCPTIIDEGRLGLLAILFAFIDEGRKVWVVGGGNNKYQFIYAQDLIDAMLLAAKHPSSATFGVGSDNVTSMTDTYRYVIEKAGTKARVATLPKWPTIFAMRIAHLLRISPLGPYHYKMIAEDFSFDTTAVKRDLAWKPTVSNREMLYFSYRYYSKNRHEIESREHVSAHRRPARMGIIGLLKRFS